MLRGILFVALLASLVAAGSAQAADKPWNFQLAPATEVERASIGAKPRSAVLVRVYADIPEGREWANVTSWSYIGSEVLAWRGTRSEIKTEDFAHAFSDVLASSGFSEGPKTSLFASDTGADFQVGVVIKEVSGRFCAGCGLTVPNDYARGASRMAVEWQVFAPLERKVVLTFNTSGTYETKEHKPGVGHILDAAFRENVRKLLTSSEFRGLLLSAGPAIAAASPTPSALKISVSQAGSRPIPEAMKSVVSVFANTGMGSGFVISNEGYLLTNQHVVGETKFVKLKWADGVETLGEVVRTDARRDVALIKADLKGRTPLPLRTGAPTVGETVFAIGTPLDEKLQNTLTKGIVSAAERTFDGLAYIQSDVAVTHGNSGGPLVDEKGRVLGLTVSGRSINGAPTGLNFFIPIEDALKVLALSPAG